MNNIVWVLILSILTACSGCVSNMESSNHSQIEIAIYPTGTSSETYYFILNPESELIAEKGTRVGDDLAKKPFIKDRIEYDKKSLSSGDISKIIYLANKIFESDFNTDNGIVKDSWNIQILYKDKTIIQNCFIDVSPQIRDLIDELISISPIEVDLHGWA